MKPISEFRSIRDRVSNALWSQVYGRVNQVSNEVYSRVFSLVDSQVESQVYSQVDEVLTLETRVIP